MDPLVPIPVGRWPELRDAYRNDRPFGVAGYNLMDTQIEFHRLGIGGPFVVYCPYGAIANGMVAKITKEELQEIIIMANSDDTSKLEEALLTTNVIDWSQGRINLPYITPSTKMCLERIYPKLNLKLVEEGPAYTHVFYRTLEPFDNVVCPEGIYIAPLAYDNVEQIDKVWPHRYPSSEKFFMLLIDAGQSYGLFTVKDSTLLAWMLINEVGFLTHLYCEEPHRKRGYSELLVKYVTNERIRKGKDVHCHIVDGNVGSMALFKKLRYKVVGKSIWTFVKQVKV